MFTCRGHPRLSERGRKMIMALLTLVSKACCPRLLPSPLSSCALTTQLYSSADTHSTDNQQPRVFKVSFQILYKRPRTHAVMAILPVSSPPTPSGSQTTFSQPTMSGSSKVPMIFRRLHRFHQMVSTVCECCYSCKLTFSNRGL